MKSADFKKLVVKQFAPFLREQGWKGSGFDFRKEENQIIDVLKIQPSNYGGKFCIEIGVHFNFLPPLLDLESQINPKEITTWSLELRTRLSPNSKEDFWWTFPKNEQKSEKLFEELKALFLKKANPYFEQYQQWNTLLVDISIEKIENNKLGKSLPFGSGIRSILLIARLKEYLGEKEEAISYSMYGLSKIDGISGSGLIKYFEKIIKNCK